MTKPDRSEQINLKVSEAELAMAKEVAAREGTTVSDVVRTLVRREHKKLEASLRR